MVVGHDEVVVEGRVVVVGEPSVDYPSEETQIDSIVERRSCWETRTGCPASYWEEVAGVVVAFEEIHPCFRIVGL